MKEINVIELAKRIGMEEKESVLPNGRVVKGFNWEQSSLVKACEAVRELSGTGEEIVISGPAPAFLVSALTHTVHPCKVSLQVPQIGKNVAIPQLSKGEQNPEGEVSFKVTNTEHYVLVEYSLTNPVYDEANLPKIVVPEIPSGKPVYLSGKAPNYVTVAVAEAYAHTNASVSLFQPGIGYTCSITHSRARQLGMLEKTPMEHAINLASVANSAKEVAQENTEE